MPKETSVDSKNAFAQLTAQGAASTQVVLIQLDDSDPYNCTLVARGLNEAGETMQDITLCPSPCNIGKAFNPAK